MACRLSSGCFLARIRNSSTANAMACLEPCDGRAALGTKWERFENGQERQPHGN